LTLEKVAPVAGRNARDELVQLPGVVAKLPIACSCLGYVSIRFPVDVWVIKALQNFIFAPSRSAKRLRHFSETHFGPNAAMRSNICFITCEPKTKMQRQRGTRIASNEKHWKFSLPRRFCGIESRKLDDTLCVVFDIFRATSSMVTALATRGLSFPSGKFRALLSAPVPCRPACPANATGAH